MVSVMQVDVAARPHFIIATGISVLLLVIAIIVGATGPNEFISSTYDAYLCPNNEHIVFGSDCSGVQLSDNTSYWEQEAPPVTGLNQYWSLQYMPYTSQDTSLSSVMRELVVSVQLYAKKNPEDNWILIDNITTYEIVACPQGFNTCNTIDLIDEQLLDYTYYKVRVRFLNAGVLPGDNLPFIADVIFTFFSDSATFSSMELAFRIAFMFITSIVLIAYLYFMRNTSIPDWAWEQRALALLLFGLLGFNNPFFGLKFVVTGWFFNFLDALLNVVFLSIFLLFSLMVMDKLRMEQVRVEFGLHQLPKMLVVGVFAVLSIILFGWWNIGGVYDPVIGRPSVLAGQLILFYLVSSLYSGMLIWLAVLIIMTIPIATAKPYLQTRFLFIGMPTAFCVIAVLVGIFTGTFGPVERTTLAMVFYLTMFNVYVWFLTFGFWPVQTRFSARNPTESDAVLHFNNNFIL